MADRQIPNTTQYLLHINFDRMSHIIMELFDFRTIITTFRLNKQKKKLSNSLYSIPIRRLSSVFLSVFLKILASTCNRKLNNLCFNKALIKLLYTN